MSAIAAARLFTPDGRLRVPPPAAEARGGGFNALFGDHVAGAVKTLRLELTGGPGGPGPVVLEVAEDGSVALALPPAPPAAAASGGGDGGGGGDAAGR